MNNKLAIKMVEQQIEEAMRLHHLDEEEFATATTVVHALEIVLKLAKERVEELEE